MRHRLQPAGFNIGDFPPAVLRQSGEKTGSDRDGSGISEQRRVLAMDSKVRPRLFRPCLRRFYCEQTVKRGCGSARVAPIRKVCSIMRRMLLTGEEFRPIEHGLFERKLKAYEKTLEEMREERKSVCLRSPAPPSHPWQGGTGLASSEGDVSIRTCVAFKGNESEKNLLFVANFSGKLEVGVGPPGDRNGQHTERSRRLPGASSCGTPAWVGRFRLGASDRRPEHRRTTDGQKTGTE